MLMLNPVRLNRKIEMRPPPKFRLAQIEELLSWFGAPPPPPTRHNHSSLR